MNDLHNATVKAALKGDVAAIAALADMLAEAGESPCTPTQEELDRARHDWRARNQLVFRALGVHLDVEIEDERPARCRARRLDLGLVVDAVAEKAYVSGEAIYADHGGDVARAYGYPAQTDAVLAVGYYDPAVKTIHIRASARRISARHVTRRAAAAAAGYPDAYDGRVRRDRRAADRKRAVQDLRERVARERSEVEP